MNGRNGKSFLWLLVCALAFTSCRCGDVDCSNTPYFGFRIIDNAGNDLVFKMNEPVEHFTLETVTGTIIPISTVNDHQDFLIARLIPGLTQYTLRYKSESVGLLVTYETYHEDCCANEFQRVTSVSTSANSLAMDPAFSDIDVYIVRLQ